MRVYVLDRMMKMPMSVGNIFGDVSLWVIMFMLALGVVMAVFVLDQFVRVIMRMGFA